MSYSRSPRELRSTTMGTSGMAASVEGRVRTRPERSDQALRRRSARAVRLRAGDPRGQLLRAARAQRGGQDDADLGGVQPHPDHGGGHPGLRASAPLDRGAPPDRARGAGRQPRPLSRRRGDARLPRRLLRAVAPDGTAAGAGDDGRLRPPRKGKDAGAEAVGRHAPPAAACAGAHARAAAGDPRRANRRGRLRAAHGAVALHPAAALLRHDDPAHHALPRRGRGALRGDRAHPRRRARRARHRRGAARCLRRDVADRCVPEGDGGMSELITRHRPLFWLTRREVLRVSKLWTQTIAAPVIASFLFILVFGLSLGGRIKRIDGYSYDVFIVPGLITMAMVQAAYSNTASSVFQARFDRYLHDVLAAPMRNWEVNLGLSLGGAVRALAIGVSLLGLSLLAVDVPIEQPGVLVLAVLLALMLFSALGVVVGIYAVNFDHHTFVNNIIILPLTFLGGVFYSVSRLPSPWQEISHANPIFYLVSAVRYGFLGRGDAPIGLCLGVTAVLAIAAVAWSSWLFRTGRRLKA